MSYTITNTYYKIVIKLQTTLTTIPTMTYKHIEQQYANSNPITNYITKTVTDTDLTDGVITYKIPLSEFEIGDVLDDFVCTLSGTQNLYDLNEGITILIDGEEANVIKVENGSTVKDEDDNYVVENPVKSPQFATIFQGTNEHTIQAIYKGNNNIGVSLSDKAVITPIIRQEDEPNPTIKGNYKLEFTKFKNSMSYMGTVDWEFKLTKGGQAVPNALIQIDTPNGTYTHISDSKGKVTFKRNASVIQDDMSKLPTFRHWNVGSYTVQARFHYYDGTTHTFKELICKTSKTLKINKGTPSMSVVNYARTKKGTAKFKLKDPLGFNLEDTKLVCVVNGKTYNKTTNSYGNISFKIGVKGHIKYKIKFAGNKNMKAKTWTFSETIS